MIVTLTINPAVDQTLWVDHLELGCVNRPTEVQLDPAGKGVNVSRMAHRLGWPTIALGFVAGDLGHMIQTALDAERVQHHFVMVPGQTRMNVTITERGSRRGTSFYGPGPAVHPAALATLDEMLGFWVQASKVLVLAGSLVPGVPEDYYARLVRRARAFGVRTIVDGDGVVERLAIAAEPWMIKPNVHEAERLLGRKLCGLDEVVAGARELSGRGVEVVLVSMGSEGAVCVERDRAWRVRAPQVAHLSTVGSGDSLVAGVAVAIARGDDLAAGLRLGTAAGAATAMSPGTALGTADDIAHLLGGVTVEQI